MEKINCPKCGSELASVVRENGRVVRLTLGAITVSEMSGFCGNCGVPVQFTSGKRYMLRDYIDPDPGESGSKE